MKDLQKLNTGDIIYYAGKSRTIKDWFVFKNRQFADDGTAIWAIPILDNGQLLDWPYWGEVMTAQDLWDIIGLENLQTATPDEPVCTCSMDDGIHEWNCAFEIARREWNNKRGD